MTLRAAERAAVGLLREPLSFSRLDRLAAKVAGTLEKTELMALVEAFEGTRQLPRDLDRQLLAGGRSLIGRDLDAAEKKRVRASFVDGCRRRLAD